MKDDILKRLVTWATGVNTINGTYTLSRDQYQELRAMQKDAMVALKPEPPKLQSLAGRLSLTMPAGPMWHGYKWRDVHVAIWAHASTWTDRRLEWAVFNPDTKSVVAKVDIYSDRSELDFASWEPGMRAQGLRRPDEPDYKPL